METAMDIAMPVEILINVNVIRSLGPIYNPDTGLGPVQALFQLIQQHHGNSDGYSNTC